MHYAKTLHDFINISFIQFTTKLEPRYAEIACLNLFEWIYGSGYIRWDWIIFNFTRSHPFHASHAMPCPLFRTFCRTRRTARWPPAASPDVVLLSVGILVRHRQKLAAHERSKVAMATIPPGPFLQLLPPCNWHWRKLLTIRHFLRIVPDFLPSRLHFSSPWTH